MILTICFENTRGKNFHSKTIPYEEIDNETMTIKKYEDYYLVDNKLKVASRQALENALHTKYIIGSSYPSDVVKCQFFNFTCRMTRCASHIADPIKYLIKTYLDLLDSHSEIGETNDE